jgi:hypothetical protein
VTDAELRADLIARGVLRPIGSRHAVFATDHVGRRSAAADIFFGEGPAIAAVVVENSQADTAVKAILRRWLARAEAA